MAQKNRYLMAGGIASLLVSVLHVGIIIGGADWYRFFGAGEEFARLAESGSLYPAFITSGITIVFAIWGLYAFSGAGIIGRLPLLRTALVIIASIYLLRGLGGIPLVFIAEGAYAQELSESITFMLISSIISLALGLLYAWGTKQAWPTLT